MFDFHANPVLASNMVVLSIFGVLGAIVLYVWLGFKITNKISEIYDYNIWNFVTVPLMAYSVFVWFAYIFFTPTLEQYHQQMLMMQLSSAVCFLIAFSWNAFHSSVLWSLAVTIYQTTLSIVAFWLLLMGFLGGGSTKEK